MLSNEQKIIELIDEIPELQNVPTSEIVEFIVGLYDPKGQDG